MDAVLQSGYGSGMDISAYEKMANIEERSWWYRGRRTVCRALLERYFGGASKSEILDVGCGTGYNLQWLERFGNCRGVDMSELALQYCREKGLDKVLHHEAEGLPFADSEFELLTAFDVVEHISDDRAALQEFRRVLKPDGLVLIYTPALPQLYNEHDRIVHHKRRYRKSELEDKLSSAGFEVLHSSYVNFLMLPVVLLARFLMSLRTERRHREMEVPPEPFNFLFTQICQLESRWVLSGGPPVGITLALVARRTESAG